jgi:hypothetical protein
MSLPKTALACVLLAVLASQAGAQTIRPATSKALGQVTSFAGSPPAASATAVSAQTPLAGPAIPQEIISDSSPSDSWNEAWASDATATDSPESVLPETIYAPQANPLIYDPPSASTWNPTAAPMGGGCSGGNCSDGSSSSAADWLGSYRFAGGNASFNGPWYVSADAFLLHRSNGNQNMPITVDGNTNNTLLSVRDLTFTSKVGPRLMFGYAWSHTTAFEVSYFGLIDSRTSTNQTGASNLTLPGALAFIATDFFNASQVGVNYNSRLNNAEFNVLRNTGSSSLSWLYGFRYLGLNEHFDISSTGAIGTGRYDISTRNNMFGIQGGARWMFNYKCFALESTVKCGVLENATQQTQNVNDPAYPITVRDTLAKGANVSFLSELNVNAIYRLSEKWAIRTGYTLIWVDGLALAPNQLDTTFTAVSGTTLNHGGNIFLSAINLGVELHW